MEGVQMTWPELPEDVDGVIVIPSERALLPPKELDAPSDEGPEEKPPAETSRPV
jgi:hypothetical protein